MPPLVGGFCPPAPAFFFEAASGVTSNLCHVKVNHSHESPPISSYRGRGPRGRRTGIRRAGRQLETAARRLDRLWMVREIRHPAADSGRAGGGGLALRRGPPHAFGSRGAGVRAPDFP